MELNLKFKWLLSSGYHAKMCVFASFMCATLPRNAVNTWISHATFTDELAYMCERWKAGFKNTLRLVKHHQKNIQASKTVTVLLSRKPRACLASIIKHSPLSIKTYCLLVCLLVSVEAHGLSPPRIHSTHSVVFQYSQWCKTCTSNILFSYIPQ